VFPECTGAGASAGDVACRHGKETARYKCGVHTGLSPLFAAVQ